MSRREKEEVISKLAQAERMLSEGKRTIQKLEDDNSKLRRALEQNMTRLNRMSIDSDNYVDRYFSIYSINSFNCLTICCMRSSKMLLEIRICGQILHPCLYG